MGKYLRGEYVWDDTFVQITMEDKIEFEVYFGIENFAPLARLANLSFRTV
jgi:hypothetical protein